jgi:hypothetical protein
MTEGEVVALLHLIRSPDVRPFIMFYNLSECYIKVFETGLYPAITVHPPLITLMFILIVIIADHLFAFFSLMLALFTATASFMVTIHSPLSNEQQDDISYWARPHLASATVSGNGIGHPRGADWTEVCLSYPYPSFPLPTHSFFLCLHPASNIAHSLTPSQDSLWVAVFATLHHHHHHWQLLQDVHKCSCRWELLRA